MNKKNGMNQLLYRENSMTDHICTVCGEHLGKLGYVYRGKSLCRECVEHIRSCY